MDKTLKKFVVEVSSDNAFITGVDMLGYMRLAAINASDREGADIEGGDVDFDILEEQLRFLQAAAKNKEFTFLNADKSSGRKFERESKIEIENAQKYLKGIGIELRVVAPLTNLEVCEVAPLVKIAELGNEHASDIVKAKSKLSAHEQNILKIITELGIDPLALPWHKNGTPGTKSKVMKIVLMNTGLGISRTSFKHAWDRLNKFKYIRSLDQ
ncbi:MAG: hypothetical protein V4624_09935 [Pseudomonadota bacterium]